MFSEIASSGLNIEISELDALSQLEKENSISDDSGDAIKLSDSSPKNKQRMMQ